MENLQKSVGKAVLRFLNFPKLQQLFHYFEDYIDWVCESLKRGKYNKCWMDRFFCEFKFLFKSKWLSEKEKMYFVAGFFKKYPDASQNLNYYLNYIAPL